MKYTKYRGRFAPSPSGELHFGSLLAAMASYADARSHHGQWLLRIDDIDQARVTQDSDKHIIKSLEQCGFQWDENISYQSESIKDYHEALEQLKKNNLSYACSCSRTQIKMLSNSGIYPGTCRNKGIDQHLEYSDTDYAIRLKVHSETILFTDKIQHLCRQNLAREVGDFIIFRRDKVFSYQLSVVVDDYLSRITHIVRGFDLLNSTARQIYCQQQLGYPTPQYAHIPLAVTNKQIKLSKLSQAKKIDSEIPTLVLAAQFLGQDICTDKDYDNMTDFWQHLCQIWDIDKIPKQEKIEVLY